MKGKAKQKILLLLLFFAFIFFLPGCINPNSNLSYSTCCIQSDKPYACTLELDSKQNPLKEDGYFILSNCGDCKYLDSNGNAYDSSKKPISIDQCHDKDHASSCNFRRADCSGSDGNNTCYLLDENNNIVQDLQGKKVSVAPICTPPPPNPCIQAQCAAFMCGEPVPQPKQRMNAEEISKLAENSDESKKNQQSYVDLASSNQPTGLVGKICRLEKMDKRAIRLLNGKDWFVDSFRLGISGTFSDYDRARYYIPPSDFYCSNRVSAGAVVDRFTAYLDGDKPLKIFRQGQEQPGICALRGWRCPLNNQLFDNQQTCNTNCRNNQGERVDCTEDWVCSLNEQSYGSGYECNTNCISTTQQINFQARISYCIPEPEQDAVGDQNKVVVVQPSAYYCSIDPTLKFSAASFGSAEAALLACNNACSPNRFRQCKDLPHLLLYNQTVSPPQTVSTGLGGVTVRGPINWSFTDIDSYAKALEKAYPTPAPNKPVSAEQDPRNYYKMLLPFPDLTNKSEVMTYQKNLLQPGPAGGKVFECTSNADCLSGQCDKTSYLRGSCFLKNGSAVDCDCHYVIDCKKEYPCETLPQWGAPREICISNRERCRAAFGGEDRLEGHSIVVCKYTPGYLDVFSYGGWVPSKPDVTDSSYAKDGVIFYVGMFNYFPCAPYDPKHVPAIEFANRQVYANETPVCNKSGTLVEPVCKEGALWSRACSDFSGFDSKVDTYIGQDCTGEDYGWETVTISTISGDYRKNAKCEEGILVKSKEISAWRDNNAWAEDNLRRSTGGDGWLEDLYPVPDRPSVAGPYNLSVQGYNVKGLLFTSKSVHFCNDSPNLSLSGLGGRCDETKPENCTCSGPLNILWNDVKFKLIQACNMQYGKDIVLYRPDQNNRTSPVHPDERGGFVEKTWLILSFGDCQVDSNGMPITVSYGICRPCSTFLTIAEQNVSNTSKPYCPAGCSTRKSVDGKDLCICGRDERALPYKKFLKEAGSDTFPEFSFLMGKIDEFQRANIIPLLDLRTYSNFSRNVGEFTIAYSENCLDYGATENKTKVLYYDMDNSDEGPSFIPAGVHVCAGGPTPSFLLKSLAANHSAVILNVASLPADGDDIALNKARERVAWAKEGCPDCLISLEYDSAIDISTLDSIKDGYPQDLNNRIKFYSNGVEFNASSFDPPQWVDDAGRQAVSNVSMLIIDVNLSKVPVNDPALLDTKINYLINLSRHVLQHVGWPTIFRIAFARQDAGSLAHQELYKAIYRRQAELTLAGARAILLPPLDNAGAERVGEKYSGTGQLLDNNGLRASINDENTPFCAAVNGSTEYLRPKIIVGLQRVFAKDSCRCIPCTSVEIASGQCNQKCYDGRPGNGTNGGGCSSTEKCEPFCVRSQFCPVVNDSLVGDKKTTCMAIRSTNQPPIKCAKICKSRTDPSLNDPPGSHCWPDCDIQEDIPLKELADPILHPDANYLIAGLPPAYCIQQNGTLYTYLASASIQTSPEPVLFPRYGSPTSDCGRTIVPGVDSSQLACGTPLPPVSDALWKCQEPQ